MDRAVTDLGPVAGKVNIEERQLRNRYRCSHYDPKVVHKIAGLFIAGLAKACIENTTGNPFRSPCNVAVDLRKEMIQFVIDRSERSVVESVEQGGSDLEVPDRSYSLIADFVDDFACSKKSWLHRFTDSGMLEDKTSKFMEDMEVSKFWVTDRREDIAKIVLKIVDVKNYSHCNEQFETDEELQEHVLKCGLRSVNCFNEGCEAVFCAVHTRKHDSVCGFKLIPCEQKCEEKVIRRDMDRHCLTVCAMRPVKCPFHSVGCRGDFPHCLIQQHLSDDIHSHLLYTLQTLHKEASSENLNARVDLLMQLSFSERAAAAKDARTLTFIIKDLEEKVRLEPFMAES